jgi:hypothetical protein
MILKTDIVKIDIYFSLRAKEKCLSLKSKTNLFSIYEVIFSIVQVFLNKARRLVYLFWLTGRLKPLKRRGRKPEDSTFDTLNNINWFIRNYLIFP